MNYDYVVSRQIYLKRQVKQVYHYSSFDYLCNEPFYLQDIGYVKCPTLRDIRKKGYLFFKIMLTMLFSSKEELLEQYEGALGDSFQNTSKFDFLISMDPNMLQETLAFLICHNVEFTDGTYIVSEMDEENQKVLCGYINHDNFDFFCDEIQKILGMKQESNSELKFKNSLAQKMFDKLQKHKKGQKQNYDENYELDNMIKKYCTHNKVGINILNVWDMTYYQFMAMFNEYCNGRQCDFNDMMAANTFQYKKSTDYKPLDYMKKLNNN